MRPKDNKDPQRWNHQRIDEGKGRRCRLLRGWQERGSPTYRRFSTLIRDTYAGARVRIGGFIYQVQVAGLT